jgi:NAD(P)-dependent dehydrogenase (short-subunit alcohol dehydrogenase family)
MHISSARAVVTGGASGLGHAVARHFIAQGATVTLLDVQAESGERAARELGERAFFAQCDVSSESAVNAAMAAAAHHMDGLNLLVNCAGVIGAARALGRNGPMPGEQFAKVVNINLVGTFLCDKAAAEIMQRNAPSPDGERGVIVHTSSVAAFEGQIGQAAYSATKAGVAGMTLPLAREFAAFGIRVMTIAPGTMGTPRMMAAPEKIRVDLASQVPHPNRLGDPDEFAMLVEHFARNAYLNGTTIRLDGAVRFPPK